MGSNLYQCAFPAPQMEDVKVLVLTIWPKTIMKSSPHFANMAAIILLPNLTCKVSKLSHSEIRVRFFLCYHERFS